MTNLLIRQFKGWRLPEVAWLIFSIASITALSIYWGDTTIGIIAAVTGMAYTVLAGKGKVSCFLFGIVIDTSGWLELPFIPNASLATAVTTYFSYPLK